MRQGHQVTSSFLHGAVSLAEIQTVVFVYRSCVVACRNLRFFSSPTSMRRGVLHNMHARVSTDMYLFVWELLGILPFVWCGYASTLSSSNLNFPRSADVHVPTFLCGHVLFRCSKGQRIGNSWEPCELFWFGTLASKSCSGANQAYLPPFGFLCFLWKTGFF